MLCRRQPGAGRHRPAAGLRRQAADRPRHRGPAARCGGPARRRPCAGCASCRSTSASAPTRSAPGSPAAASPSLRACRCSMPRPPAGWPRPAGEGCPGPCPGRIRAPAHGPSLPRHRGGDQAGLGGAGPVPAEALWPQRPGDRDLQVPDHVGGSLRGRHGPVQAGAQGRSARSRRLAVFCAAPASTSCRSS